MARDRTSFRNQLVKAFELGEKENIYYQPPPKFKMEYPCIVYTMEMPKQNNANNYNYLLTNKYRVTVIDRNPDTELPYRILRLFSYVRILDRAIIDNLNHVYMEIYY